MALFLALLLLAAACRPPASAPAQAISSDLVLATVVPIGDIKPFASRQGIGANLVELLYRPLFRFSKDGVMRPELARNFEWRDEGKALRIILGEGQAENVVYTMDFVRKLPIPEFKEGLKNLVAIERAGPTELIFRLKRFDRIFLFLLSQIPILSAKSEETTGEFAIESQKPEEVVLKRKVPSPNGVNRIIIRQIPTPRRVIREFVAGNVDLSFLTDEAVAEVLGDIPELGFGELESTFLYFVLVNRSRPALNQIAWSDVGRSLNRGDMIEQLGRKGLSPAKVPVKASDRWAVTDPTPAPMPFRMKKPRAQELSLSFLNTQSNESRIALLLKRHLEEMGIAISMNYLNPQDFGKKILQTKDFDLVLLPYAIKDALTSNYFVFHSAEGEGSVNLSGYNNPEVDRHLEESRFEYDEAKAKRAFARALEAMQKDPPGIFLFWLRSPILYRKSCAGFKFNTNEFFSSLKDVRCEPSAAN